MYQKCDFERSKSGSCIIAMYLALSLLLIVWFFVPLKLDPDNVEKTSLVYVILIPTFCIIPSLFFFSKTYTVSDENSGSVLLLKVGTLLFSCSMLGMCLSFGHYFMTGYFALVTMVHASLFMAKDSPYGIVQPFRLCTFKEAKRERRKKVQDEETASARAEI